MGYSLDFPETPDIETSSDDYAQRFSGDIGEWFLKVQEEASMRMLADYPNAKVLDVGGGHGQIAHSLVQGGYQVTVLGSDEPCRKRLQSFLDGDRCSFSVGNILDLPFGDQSFDVVISYRLLPHVNQWKRFLAELSRVAKRAVIVDYPAKPSVNFMTPILFPLKKHVEGNTRMYRSFWESELLTVFENSGFVPADRCPQFLLPMVLHRTLQSVQLSLKLEETFRLLGMTGLFGSPVILKMIRVHA